MHIYSARQTADGRTADGRTHGRRQTDARTARTARTHARQTDARTRTAGADRLPDPSCFTTRSLFHFSADAPVRGISLLYDSILAFEGAVMLLYD